MRLFLATLAFAGAISAAYAKPSVPVTEFSGDRYVARSAASVAVGRQRSRQHVAHAHVRYLYRVTKHPMRHPLPRPRPESAPGEIAPLTLGGGFQREMRTAIVGSRPAGCPHAFCGCGASLHLFGRIIPALNLAANWLRFPRAEPAPNMVAARRGHVFVLKQHIDGNVWLAFDANSGGHRTRIHPRSIAGFQIVNPHGRV